MSISKKEERRRRAEFLGLLYQDRKRVVTSANNATINYGLSD